ncbi:MAG: hypothetical protein V7K27_01930 [Nostoc sp.]|uniref:hypothetical protein n=1 Tax=Nostoc sp. TaxID=1180 RepID=UPI002FF99DD8
MKYANLNFYEELSDQTAEKMSGGATYTFKNRNVRSGIQFSILGASGQVIQAGTLQPFSFLLPGDTVTLNIPERKVTVLYDSDSSYGGVSPRKIETTPGESFFYNFITIAGSEVVALSTPKDGISFDSPNLPIG